LHPCAAVLSRSPPPRSRRGAVARRTATPLAAARRPAHRQRDVHLPLSIDGRRCPWAATRRARRRGASCAKRSWRVPAAPSSNATPTSRPSIGDWPSGAVTRRPSSRSPTASWSSPITCCATASRITSSAAPTSIASTPTASPATIPSGWPPWAMPCDLDGLVLASVVDQDHAVDALANALYSVPRRLGGVVRRHDEYQARARRRLRAMHRAR